MNTTKNVSIAIAGAGGRMGGRLIALAAEDPVLEIVAATEAAGHAAVGKDAGVVAGVEPLGVTITETPDPDALAGALLIDFTTPEATRQNIAFCERSGVGMVVGTTGLTDADQAAIDKAAARAPMLWASNYSLVVNVLFELAARAADMLGGGFDIEILEAHHRFKKDAPSGTALTLAQRICEAAGREFDRDVVFTRHGDDVTRQPNEITMQTLRIGDHPGEHTAYFAGLGERLEIKHVSTSRDSYVKGALQAAKWLAGRPAGRYGMNDVLGL
jgi:4-hydroxy-tetrahydrodipicolinate reductase